MIEDFRYRYRFLSNFAYAEVTLDGVQYATVEHAYQAAKCSDPVYRQRIQDAKTPGDAKRIGNTAYLRKDWQKVKIAIMYDLVRQKFKQPTLQKALLDTESEELIEDNPWGDTFWGVCKGAGENHLGKILMAVREEIKRESLT